ncbi:MAG TPA: hydroxymethylbilane synthase [Candidatus Saccharimonadia bacterium]|nr:hydroxymethylbilane synthase [Candidatus Saccharimonadia bacterium]
MARVRIATRESALALWQAEHVASRLRAQHAGLEVELVPMTTRGDTLLDTPLAHIGGKGLFLKELEVALLERRADLAVHSMKDVPMALEPDFEIAAVLAREDPFDAFVSSAHATLATLPAGARVGTSSLRRQSQLRARRADLELVDLRGNVNSRLRKLDEGRYDAIVLAIAGLQRLGFGARIRERLAAPEWVPAVAQGAIGVEVRAGDVAIAALVAPLVDRDTSACVSAERAMNRALHGSCQVPVAGYARLVGASGMHLTGLVGDAATGRLVRAEAEGDAADPEALGRRVAAALAERGAREILDRS